MTKEEINYAVEKISGLTNGFGKEFIEYSLFELHVSTVILSILLLIGIGILIWSVHHINKYENATSFWCKVEQHSYGWVFIVGISFTVIFGMFTIANIYDIYISNYYPEMWAFDKLLSSSK